MGLYIDDKDVETRLRGKVTFTDDECEENKMPRTLLKRLVEEAEGEVELDLSPRYCAPFQTDDGGAFKTLPPRPTRNILRELCELKSVCRVLETDFGTGSAVNGETYKEGQEKRYKTISDQLLEHRAKDHSQWKFPPLPGLKLNYQNQEADDGFAGKVLVSGSNTGGGYPADRINDPSQSFYNARFDTRFDEE